MKITPTDHTSETCQKVALALSDHFAGTRFKIGAIDVEGERKPYVPLQADH